MFQKFAASMVEKKSLISAIKKALQNGVFNYVGQQITEFPQQIWNIDQSKIDDQHWWQSNPITKIDVSNNEITNIPEQIVNLGDLQVLRMKNNLVKEISGCLVGLQNLKSLDLSKNKVVTIPEKISNFPSLVQLNFSQNLLQYCPNLDTIQTLQLIFLNNNKLKNLPNLGNGIKKAQLQENQIKTIHRLNFVKCAHIENINLSKNFIQQIQNGAFSNSHNLIVLELKQNRLTTFTQLPNSQKLDTLSLSFNRLTQFPYYDRCPNLTVLILSDNKIKKLSKQIIKLKKLKTLDLSNNDLSDLPCEIGFITTLVRIQIEGNPLKTMRQNIRTGGTDIIKKYLQDRMDPNQKQQLQKQLKTTPQTINHDQYWIKLLQEFIQGEELQLKKMRLKQLDQSVFQKKLKCINISENNITRISESIGKIQQLRSLIVNANQIQFIPQSLQRLTQLEQLQAKNNKIEHFSIKSPNPYPKLHYLDLSANRIKSFPQAILSLPKLRNLYLSYNNIPDIECLLENPKAVCHLEVLDVSNNKISNISDNIFNRIQLNYFNIENNNLNKIPTVIGFMKLSGLKIDGNPLKLIKRTVIDKGTVAILQHLKTKHSGQIPKHPNNIMQQQKPPEYILQPQKPNYPYETQPKLIKNIEYKPPTTPINEQQYTPKIQQLQKQINKIQEELNNNMGLNTIQKNNKKRLMQSLMIEKNKLTLKNK